MTQEFDNAAQEPKDYTKLVWGGVGVLVLAMVLFMVFNGGGTPRRSEVRTKHILIKFDASDPADKARALELINGLREQIVSGKATFEEIAEKYSDDPTTAKKGGFLGSHARGEMQKQYDDYAWTAPVGQLSGIIQTSFGFHLMVVLDRYISPGEQYEQEIERRIKEGEAAPNLGESSPESATTNAQ